MTEICDIAAQLLRDFAPKALLNQCGQLAYIQHQMDVMTFIIETMVNRNALVTPQKDEKLCVFGVKR